MSGDGSFDADDLLEIRERLKALTKEKEMLRDSKSEGFDLIKRLEFHVKTLSESRGEDKKRITDLERELNNCIQEIDYLQDQLSARGEQACNCRSRLADTKSLSEEVGRLEEQLKMSEFEKSLLMQELEDKDDEIRSSASRIESLEESISTMALEYQCEIESIKLDAGTLKQNLFETKRLLKERTQENSRENGLFQDVELQNEDTCKVIERLREENEDLKEKLQMSDLSITTFANDVEEHLHERMAINDVQPSSKDMSTYGNVLGPLFSKLASSRATDEDLRSKIARMSSQIDDYELLTRRLKEQLREERVKAKEEAEDLAQEMAELRYQLTLRLDEERKRRASIENLSLQRITELEAQIAEERKKSTSPQDLVLWKE